MDRCHLSHDSNLAGVALSAIPQFLGSRLDAYGILKTNGFQHSVSEAKIRSTPDVGFEVSDTASYYD